jgi:formylglycine-generating enzyme required for sulfatase activity
MPFRIHPPYLWLAGLAVLGLVAVGGPPCSADEAAVPGNGEEEAEGEPAPPPAAPSLDERPVPVPSAVPGPPGMVYVAVEDAEIGSTPEEVLSLTQGRDADTRAQIAFEIPRHKPKEMVPYFILRYEVTNAQYLVFLKDTAATVYDTTKGNLANLVALAGFLLSTEKDKIERDNVSWRQIYRMNKEILWEKMPAVIVKDAAGVLDEKKTEEAFRYAPLAKGISLRFWRRRPPQDWMAGEPTPEEMRLPVTWVSYIDCEAFCEWAGLHVPTEAEWEWAMRGKEGRRYPWGNEWYPDAKHANWGGKIVGKDYKPRKVAVDDPEFLWGQSPYGLLQGEGNVAEWTSSWFRGYPGNNRDHPNAGTYAKVIRGGSLIDQDLLVLRCAFRNFIGKGPEAPPVPQNRFEFVGFRTAWYPVPGRDQYYPVVTRAVRGKAVTEGELSFEGLTGAVATQFAPSEEQVQDCVFVTGRAHAIVVIPKRILIPGSDEKKKYKNLDALLDESEESEGDAEPNPIVVGAFHTDIALEKVWIKKPPEPGSEASTRRRDRKKGLELVNSTCRPGTYLLAVHRRRIALVTPELEVACYLSEDEADKKKLVEMRKIEEGETAKIEVEDDTDLVSFSVLVPVGGKGADPAWTLIVRGVLETKSGALSDAGAWRVP